MKTPLTQKQIVRAIADANTSEQAIINLWKLLFPMWNDIEKIEGFPKISRNTFKYILKAGHGKFESEFYGWWIKLGFGSSSDIEEDWIADITEAKIIWSPLMIPDEPVRKNFNPEIRIRFCDHLDAINIPKLDKPEKEEMK